IHTSKNDNVKIEVYGMNGAHIKTLAKGTLSLGSHRFSLEDLSQGLYMLRVQGTMGVLNRTITIK
ncbi:MAG TPA: T9SS type A sorting domain-containing protein, partial [Fibrobacteraceae bacterium]|nr:T9SS type A sorting domain-containing protein [Fibrobacteraceae bacterium]